MKIGDTFPKTISNQEYIEIVDWCRDNEAFVADMTDYWEICGIPIDPYADLRNEMNDLLNFLDETDYQVIKCLEQGLDIDVVYPGSKEQRQSARTRIDEIREIITN